jgi:hypothetical protein
MMTYLGSFLALFLVVIQLPISSAFAQTPQLEEIKQLDQMIFDLRNQMQDMISLAGNLDDEERERDMVDFNSKLTELRELESKRATLLAAQPIAAASEITSDPQSERERLPLYVAEPPISLDEAYEYINASPAKAYVGLDHFVLLSYADDSLFSITSYETWNKFFEVVKSGVTKGNFPSTTSMIFLVSIFQDLENLMENAGIVSHLTDGEEGGYDSYEEKKMYFTSEYVQALAMAKWLDSKPYTQDVWDVLTSVYKKKTLPWPGMRRDFYMRSFQWHTNANLVYQAAYRNGYLTNFEKQLLAVNVIHPRNLGGQDGILENLDLIENFEQLKSLMFVADFKAQTAILDHVLSAKFKLSAYELYYLIYEYYHRDLIAARSRLKLLQTNQIYFANDSAKEKEIAETKKEIQELSETARALGLKHWDRIGEITDGEKVYDRKLIMSLLEVSGWHLWTASISSRFINRTNIVDCRGLVPRN